jgi:hypothetical protein
MALLGKYATVSCAIRGAGWDACLGGLLVVGWVSCRGGAVWEGRCDRARAAATPGGQAGCGVHTAACPSTVMIVVGATA